MVSLYRGLGRYNIRGTSHLDASDVGSCSSKRLIDEYIQGEVFALMFRFDNQYPISSPAVQFVVDDKYQAPVHPVRHLHLHDRTVLTFICCTHS